MSPNGQRVAAAVSGAAHVFDVPSGKELVVFAEPGRPLHALAFLADNRTLLSAGGDKAARLDDVNVLAVLDAHAGGVTGVAFHGSANQALSAGADKAVKLWDLATGKVLRTYGPLAEAPRAVAFSRDSALVGAAAGKLVKVWNAADGKEVLTLTHPADVHGLSFSADRTRLATAAADGRARAWDLTTGQELQAFLHAGPVAVGSLRPSRSLRLWFPRRAWSRTGRADLTTRWTSGHAAWKETAG